MDNNYEAYQHAALIAKRLEGKLSAIEETELNAWINAKPENALLMEKLQDEELTKADLDFFASVKTGDAWQNIVIRTKKTSFTNKVYYFMLKWKYAAAILILFSVIVIFYKSPQPVKQQAVASSNVAYKNDVPPGTDKAKLTLADGSEITINGRMVGFVKSYAGIKISVNNGLVSYRITDTTGKLVKNQHHLITTPIGCKYKISLPDGSLVWLNSASSLKFSMAFNQLDRKVYLTGEAYFEVAKNKLKPFKVLANNTVVQVLGTHFNVHAYNDEKAVKTTLLEGSVKIYTGGRSKTIMPGQQAYIKLNSPKIKIQPIDVHKSVAWKNDLFIFDGEDMESVMKQVARWYNVEVEYKDGIPQTHISGSISRNNNLSQILNMLELTGGVHFGIDGRKIIVTR
jgi:ferric-dicitrate binding protein FerR (iron transport regulator)